MLLLIIQLFANFLGFVTCAKVGIRLHKLPFWEPEPDGTYDYEKFMRWVDINKDAIAGESGTGNIKPSEIPAEFTYDNYTGKWEGRLDKEVISVAKSIDKWPFTKYTWTVGDLYVISSPELHIYVMSRLKKYAAVGKTFVDAGCGTGYLLLFWHFLCRHLRSKRPDGINPLRGPGNAKNEVYGLDNDEQVVELARGIASTHPQMANFPVSIWNEDILNPSQQYMSTFADKVDVMYVSPAVKDLKDIDVLVRTLKLNGVVLINICESEIKDKPDKCNAIPTLYRKASHGGVEGLVEEPEDEAHQKQKLTIVCVFATNRRAMPPAKGAAPASASKASAEAAHPSPASVSQKQRGVEVSIDVNVQLAYPHLRGM